MSYLFMQTTVGIIKCTVSSITLFRSWIPDIVGSLTTRTRSVPVIAAIAEQPVPGGPSIIIKSL